MPKWNRGMEAAEAAAKAASGSRADWFSLKSGDKAYVRPITDRDDIIVIDVHMGVPTKKPPKNVKADKWPTQMSAVCQNAPAFLLLDGDDEPTEVYEDGYGHCYIHEHMQDVMGKFKKSVAIPSSQGWGLFVMREPVLDGRQKLTGFRDIMEEFKDKDGKTHRIPKIVIASQSYTNFWAAFKAAGYMTGTICDRDFSVERVDNDYVISAGRETPDLQPGKPGWQPYLDAMELKGVSLEETLVYQSSPEYYGRFFDPDWKEDEAEGEGEDKAADATEAAADAGETVLDDAEAEAMKARMAEAFSTQPT
jgi:hypothetical protein